MRSKFLLTLLIGGGLLASFSLGVLARQQAPEPYADNQFNWWAEVPHHPGTSHVSSSIIELFGSGGIKVNAVHQSEGSGKYQVYIDGSSIATPSAVTTAFKVDTDFKPSVNCTYFVSRSTTCTLPSAEGQSGKEILVWNASPSSAVKYCTTMDQTISGSASGALSNAAPFKLDRFMSDGSNWYRE